MFRLHVLVVLSYPFLLWLSTPLQNNDAHPRKYYLDMLINFMLRFQRTL